MFGGRVSVFCVCLCVCVVGEGVCACTCGYICVIMKLTHLCHFLCSPLVLAGYFSLMSSIEDIYRTHVLICKIFLISNTFDASLRHF